MSTPTTSKTSPKSKDASAKKDVQKLQRAIVDGLEDVKAQDIQVFDTEDLSPLFERVIVASGTSNRQTKALAASVRDAVRQAGFEKPRIEGEDNGEWIIIDCGSVVTHVMQPMIRQYYHLEDLWGEKPVRLKLGAPKPAMPVKAAAKKTAAKKASTGSATRQTAALKTTAKKSAPAKTTEARGEKVTQVSKVSARSGAGASTTPSKASTASSTRTARKTPTTPTAGKTAVKATAKTPTKTSTKAPGKTVARQAAVQVVKVGESKPARKTAVAKSSAKKTTTKTGATRKKVS